MSTTVLRSFLAFAVFGAIVGCPAGKDGDTADSSGDTGDTADSQDSSDTTDTSDSGKNAEICTPVTLDEGATGTYTFSDGATDDDQKHHFDMTAGVDHVIAEVTWADTSFEFTYKIGQGFCPHDGETYAHASDSSGDIVIEARSQDLDEPADSYPAGRQWFSHITLINGSEHVKGDSIGYAMAVQTCVPEP
jgi:hypothetical protein